MKTNKLHILSALIIGALLFGACTKLSSEGEGIQKSGSNTSMRFAVRVALEGSTRAIHQKDEPGTEGEQSISSMTVLFNNLPARTFSGLTPSNATVSTPVFEIGSKEATGVSRFSTLLNASGLTLSPSDFNKQKVVSLSNFDQLVNTTDGEGKFKEFLMSATAEDANKNKIAIRPDVARDEVGQAPDYKNLFQLSVERVLSKVQVHKIATIDLKGEVAAEKGTLKVDELKYALAGSAKEAYLFRDFASDSRKMIDDTNNANHAMYEGKTYVDDKEVPEDWKGTTPHPFLQRVSDQMQGGAAINFAAKQVEVATSPGSTTNGIYFLENSTSKKITGRGQIEYNRIAYVKIYGTFVPKSGYGYYYDAAEQSASFPEVTTFPGGKYRVVVNKADYDKYKDIYGTIDSWDASSDADMKFFTQLNAYYLAVNDPAGTFYIGMQSRKIYQTLQGAYADGNTTIRRYLGGKMVWLNPVNAQLVSEPNVTYVKNANTRRNNIYDLTITGISGFGLPFDPVDPKDPNIPQPENPYQPIPDSHIKVDPLNSRILIQASVLKWNYQELNYTF